METASTLVAGVRDLVSLPEAYLKIQSLLRDPESTTEDFARAVQNDPGLAARVLRIANSAFFGVSRKVETVTLAVNLMGISRLHDLVLMTSVINTFNALPVRDMTMEVFWRRSIHTGILARMLAHQCGIFDSERLFIGGLLHDIGHLLMYMRMPEESAAAMTLSCSDGVPLADAERQLLGFHYGDVGAQLMGLWLFPESLCEICEYHAAPWFAPTYQRECALVHIAQRCMLEADPHTASQPFLPSLDSRAMTLGTLTEVMVARVIADSAAPLEEALDMLVRRRAA